MTMSGISLRAQNLNESVTIRMAALATELQEQGKDIINLTLGEPDFNTPDFIKEAAKEAIDKNFSFYPPVPGYKELRQAISLKFKRENGLDYPFGQIVVSTGAKHSLMNVILALVNPGDEVVLPAPYWVSYVEMVRFAEGVPVEIPSSLESEYKITPAQLEAAITPKTKAFMFSNPCNPSGAAYTEEELEALAKVFAKHPHVYIISDEIYEYINFAGINPSFGKYPAIKNQLITVNGLAKGYSMTGWRIGYLGAPAEVAKAVTKIQGQFTSGANSIAQRAAIAALNAGREATQEMRAKFLERRDLLLDLFLKIPNLKTARPMGAFYLFPDVSAFYGKSFNGKTMKNSDDVCAYLIEEALVATTPGSAFGSPDNIRISYATSNDKLIEAARRIKEALAKLQ
jgi:aspartate aminotransferase